MFKRLFARKELEKLERTERALDQAFQFLAFAGPARAAINYVTQVMDDRLSVNAITEIREKVREEERRVSAYLAADLNNALAREHQWRDKAQSAELSATQGWARYEQAIKKHNNLERMYAALIEENRQLKAKVK